MGKRNSREDDWIFDPSMAAMSREMRREIREEAEEVEFIVAESELRERTFADVAKEIRNRGEFIGVSTPQRVFNGYILYAAGDFLTVRSEDLEVDINLASVSYLRKLPGGRPGGRPSEEGPGTFEMRLVERKSPLDRVEIGFAPRHESLFGRITVVGQDHIVVIDDQRSEWTVPFESIAFVVRNLARRVR
jgi:hypothetical protein